MNRGKRIFLGCLGIFVILIAVFLISFGSLFKGLYERGFFAGEAKNRTYSAANSAANLKALYQAMMLYHDSEGQFPQSPGWMDAIQGRIQVADMAKEESEKKLVRPDLLPPKPGVYGYAMNDLASGKYKDDIKDKKTPLIYDSNDTTKNAHGDPAKTKLKGGVAIAVDGTILK